MSFQAFCGETDNTLSNSPKVASRIYHLLIDYVHIVNKSDVI